MSRKKRHKQQKCGGGCGGHCSTPNDKTCNSGSCGCGGKCGEKCKCKKDGRCKNCNLEICRCKEMKTCWICKQCGMQHTKKPIRCINCQNNGFDEKKYLPS